METTERPTAPQGQEKPTPAAYDTTAFDRKLVAVLNEKAPIGRAMNALAHMSLGLGASYAHREGLQLIDYTDADGGLHPQISKMPFIVLKSANGNQIRTLRKAAIAAGMHYTDFTDTMIAGSWQDQVAGTAAKKEEDLDYFGIALFGDKDTLNELTRKFSLWK